MRPIGERLWARRRRIRASAPFVLLILVLLIVLIWLTLKAAALLLSVVGLLVGLSIGWVVAYLVAQAIRRRNYGDLHSVKLFVLWLCYVAFTAIIISGIFTSGSPGRLFSFSGVVGFGLLFGFNTAFWRVLLPDPTEEPPDAGTKRRVASMRFGFQWSGLVAGLIAGLALTSYVFEPLSWYFLR